jgi:homocysteine S-methyltransferase
MNVEAGLWRDWVYGVRANASTELDAGNPAELGRRYRELCDRLPQLSVFGGGGGTDHLHIQAICDNCLP